jgi:hypothetical protein
MALMQRRLLHGAQSIATYSGFPALDSAEFKRTIKIGEP